MRHGFLLIHKRRGPTSHDVVADVRRVLHEPHIGHLGTLDPLADGLMVLAIGKKALKVVELFMGLSKEYRATVRFGAVSSTYDAEGQIEVVPPKPGWEPPVDSSRIQTLLHEHFTGRISQVPPMHSALHIDGERAYKKAQRGEVTLMPARKVSIHACTVLTYQFPSITLSVRCGSGTYIRSLAHDLGEKMRCGGYLEALQRTRVGEWSLDGAVSTDDATFSDIIPLREILRPFPALELTEPSWREISSGRVIPGRMDGDVLVAWLDGLPVALLEPSQRASGTLKARKVL